MIIIRRDDWEERLVKYVNTRLESRFVWGKFDCVKFAAGAVKAQTGLNVLKSIGTYNTSAGKALLTKYNGLFNATTECLSKFPIQSVKPTRANRGDVVGFYNDDKEEQIGIVWDVGSIVTPAKIGLAYSPMSLAVKCWSV